MWFFLQRELPEDMCQQKLHIFLVSFDFPGNKSFIPIYIIAGLILICPLITSVYGKGISGACVIVYVGGGEKNVFTLLWMKVCTSGDYWWTIATVCNTISWEIICNISYKKP